MLLIDSSVWIDYFNGLTSVQTDYLHNILDKTPVLIGDLILVEVLQGFRHDADFEKARRAMKGFLQVSVKAFVMCLKTRFCWEPFLLTCLLFYLVELLPCCRFLLLTF